MNRKVQSRISLTNRVHYCY